MPASRIMESLHGAGYRATAARRMVANAVARRGRAFTGAEILGDIQAVDRSVGRATVFRTLEVLLDLGVLDRVERPGGGRAYVLCGDEHHHHAVCSGCGLVFDIPGCGLPVDADALAQRFGFWVDGHRVEYRGLCAACRQMEAGSRVAHPYS